MKSTRSHPGIERETRFGFRVLAGILAVFLLLVGLPMAVLEARDGGTCLAWFNVACCYFAGIGFAVGARTGRWPFTLGTPG